MRPSRFTYPCLWDTKGIGPSLLVDPTLSDLNMERGEQPHKVHAPASKPRKKRNSSAKGARVELLAIKILESEGYTVHRCVRTGAKRGGLWISQNNDVFGCIDLVAKRFGQRTRWIQVTADSGIGRKKDDLSEVPWDPLFDSVEIWRWVAYKPGKHKVTGEPYDCRYFQVYHFDDQYQLDPTNKIYPVEEEKE